MSRESLEGFSCVEEVRGLLYRLAVRSIRFQVDEGAGGEAGGRRLDFILKDREAPSPDEIPLVGAVVRAASYSGLYLRFKSYEAASKPREAELASLISEALERGTGFVALVPNPLAVGLASRLPERVIEALESSSRFNVSVEYDNVLYLPDPGYSEEVELVGKRNSVASYERLRRLEAIAADLGLTVVRHNMLGSNAEIMEYVTEAGVRGLLRRVPITKIAHYVLILAGCYGIEGVNDVTLIETGEHTLYVGGAPKEFLEALIGELESLRAGQPGYGGETEALFKGYLRGSRAMAKRLGLIRV